MSILRYISHADVVIDPDVPVPRWGLSPVGRDRVVAMLDQPWLSRVGRIVCSAETKAMNTATIVAESLSLPFEIRPETGETDRSATGYVPRERHDELSNRFFGSPAQSADGWERAIDAQLRIVEAAADLISPPGKDEPEDAARPDVALIGHGGVGTLLYCHLTGSAIDAALDQPGQGHYWSFDRVVGRIMHHWLPIEPGPGPT